MCDTAHCSKNCQKDENMQQNRKLPEKYVLLSEACKITGYSKSTVSRRYRKAAAQGSAAAQNNLGAMYAEGRGVPQDKVLAYALFNLSAAGDPSKDNNAPRNRESIAQGMSREAILAGQALTRELAKPGNFAQALDAHLKASRRPR
jgi:hypothetical protein